MSTPSDGSDAPKWEPPYKCNACGYGYTYGLPDRCHYCGGDLQPTAKASNLCEVCGTQMYPADQVKCPACKTPRGEESMPPAKQNDLMPTSDPALAGGSADTERLDYLERCYRGDIHHYTSVAGPRWKLGDEYDNGQPWHPSLRAAIDASRQNATHSLQRPCSVTLDALIVAFVQGAQWWEYHKTGATMWPSDRDVAEAKAECKAIYGTLGKSPNE